MAIDPKLRNEIEAQIKRGDVSLQNMMGTTAYMVGRRMFAFWVADGLVAKLPDRERQDMVDRKKGIAHQGPQGRGSFGEWTRLHVESKDDVETVVAAARTAYDYVKGGAGAVARSAAARKKAAPKAKPAKGK